MRLSPSREKRLERGNILHHFASLNSVTLEFENTFETKAVGVLTQNLAIELVLIGINMI